MYGIEKYKSGKKVPGLKPDQFSKFERYQVANNLMATCTLSSKLGYYLAQHSDSPGLEQYCSI